MIWSYINIYGIKYKIAKAAFIANLEVKNQTH